MIGCQEGGTGWIPSRLKGERQETPLYILRGCRLLTYRMEKCRRQGLVDDECGYCSYLRDYVYNIRWRLRRLWGDRL